MRGTTGDGVGLEISQRQLKSPKDTYTKNDINLVTSNQHEWCKSKTE